jgi:hypothetical protein
VQYYQEVGSRVLPVFSPKVQHRVGRFWFRRSWNESFRNKPEQPKIEVNKAAVELTLFVVHDSAMSHDLLIGETFLSNKLVAFVKIEDRFVIGQVERELFTSVKLLVNEQVQQSVKERVTKTKKVRKPQEKLDEAAKSEVTSFVKELCVEINTKCSVVEKLSAKVAEQQLLLQAALKAKLEAEAAVASIKAECEAVRSENCWYKDQLG